jgi:membrane associated rhomboid family serine protease
VNVEVFASARPGPCRERGLVLKSVGIDHHMVQARGGFLLVVGEHDAERALAELVEYERENRGFGVEEAPDLPRTDVAPGVAAYCAVLVLAQAANAAWPAALGLGRGDAEAVRGGALWRCATALTLHADLGHLIGNLFFGGLFGALLAHVAGNGVAWLTVLTAGFLGNVANAWVHGPEHTWIGASTAVFGGLGALVTLQWTQKRFLRLKPAYRWGPILAGFTLLGYLGMSGERTDVLAHLTGFACGAALGFAYGGRGRPFRPGRATQLRMGVAAAALLALSWILAVARA